MQWHISDSEWQTLAPFLAKKPRPGPGRPCLNNDKQAAEACIYRYYHSLSESYRCFGWNQLPKDLNISASTANRRFREWNTNGAWVRFWQELQKLRDKKGTDAGKTRYARKRNAEAYEMSHLDPLRFPTTLMTLEMEGAFTFFNERFFGNTLPSQVGISIEHNSWRLCRGYHLSNIWDNGHRRLDHIVILADTIANGPEEVLAVLLHQMVHMRNTLLGISDCNPRNQYHNRHFRDVAVLAGLNCKDRDAHVGYAFTSLNDEGRRAVREFEPGEKVFRWTL